MCQAGFQNMICLLKPHQPHKLCKLLDKTVTTTEEMAQRVAPL